MATHEILGVGYRSCIGLLKNTEESVRLEGCNDQVEKVTDYTHILALDPWTLPALATDGKVVVAGRIAKRAEIRQLLTVNVSEPITAELPSISQGKRA
jgi:hypothetical protein